MAIKKQPEPPKPAPAAKKAPTGKKATERAAEEQTAKPIVTPTKALTVQPTGSRAVQVFDPSVLEMDAQSDKNTFGKDDLATPFLRVLQDLSPQKQKQHEKYVDGAEAGMFLDTSDGELWEGEETGIIAVAVHYTPSFIEWKIREKGGGFIRDHGALQPDIPVIRDTKNRDILAKNEEHQLVKSGLYYLFVLDLDNPGQFKQVAFPLQGSQLKKSREWNTRMKGLTLPRSDGNGQFTPAMFYMTWQLTTQFEKNDQGSWFGVNIKPYKPLPDVFENNTSAGWSIYAAAKEFKDMIAQGRVRVKVEETVEAEVTEVTDAVDGAY